METSHEIEQEEWAAFLQAFSAQHEGWLVDVIRHEPGGAPNTVIEDAPLRSVTTSAGGSTIRVEAGPRTTTIAAPVRVSFRETERGEHSALRIESEDGARVAIRFRVAVRPEMVDGVP